MKLSKFAHWTPIYIINRIKVFIYEILNPEAPWLTRKSNQLIDKIINNKILMIEFGSGRSTKWFSKRVKKIISLEHNKEWYNIVKDMDLSNNAEIILKENQENYINYINKFEDNYFDVCLIDGIQRGECFLNSYNKVKKKGLIIFDDANAYINNPNTSSPYSVKKPINSIYKNVNKLIKNDKILWTTNGIKDTLLIFKK